MTKKVKYLSYIEDTPKHHFLLNAIAVEAVTKAISEAKELGVSVTYIEDGKVIREMPDGEKIVIKEVEVGEVKTVEVGETAEL